MKLNSSFQQAAGPPRDSKRMSPPQRVCVLLNASSGNQGDEADRRALLDAAFKKHRMNACWEIVRGDQLHTAAQGARDRAATGEFDAVVVGGGDGTISTVASALVGSGIPLGII